MMTFAPRTAAVVLPALVFATLSTSACDIVTADFKHAATEQWRKTYELQPGGRVEVSNVNGQIRVEASAGNQVEIVAEKKAKASTEDAAKQALSQIEITEEVSASAVKIETRTPRSNGMFGGSSEVTYSVRVPAGAAVRMTTVNGGINLSRLDGEIRAETTNGGITAREVGGAIEASTTNGGVDVELTRVDKGGVTLSCTNGGIKLRVPPDTAATISAAITNGGIEVDGLTLQSTDSSRRSLHGELNGGGPRIKLDGTNGGIRIGPSTSQRLR